MILFQQRLVTRQVKLILLGLITLLFIIFFTSVSNSIITPATTPDAALNDLASTPSEMTPKPRNNFVYALLTATPIHPVNLETLNAKQELENIELVLQKK